jgi:tight adherence protein B
MSSIMLGITLAVFAMVTVGMLAACQICSRLFNRDAHRVRQRMAAEFGKEKDASDQVSLFRADDLDLELKVADAAANPDTLLTRGPKGKWHRVVLMLEQARVPLSVRQFLCLVLGVGLGLGLPTAWLLGSLAGLGAGATGAAVPFVVVNFKRRARQDKLLKQLPHAFDLMARVIRAGQSVPQALTSVAETFEDPIAGEFASCQHQQNLGLRPEVTFQELVQRSGILELRIFAMAMMIQRQTGGNLSEVLERLAGLIRSRLRLRQQVRAWTAEGRLQGWTLVALPFLMFGVLMVINRKYVQTLFDHVPLLAATLVFMAIGVLWIRRIVNFHY